MDRKPTRQSLIVLILAVVLGACLPQPAPVAPELVQGPPDPIPSPTAVEMLGAVVEGSSRFELQVPAPARPLIFPTALPEPETTWRPPPYAPPWSLGPYDHFFLGRPIQSNEVNWPNPQYRYGSTLLGEEDLHTGIDISASRGAPVVAAGAGKVVSAGYGLYRGVEDITDPYGLAVAILHDFGYEGKPLYSVYAHLGSIDVWPGQHVEAGEQLGVVGETGDASGPHLHFEVRLGENRYFSTRNPELWIVPYEGWGVLAGWVENSFGRPLYEQLIEITSLENGEHWNVWTYAQGTVLPDDHFGENFVISDLPAGPYEVLINFVGHALTAQFYLYPGRVNFLRFEGRDGFIIDPTATPANLDAPPGK